jgi:hypothetical protein
MAADHVWCFQRVDGAPPPPFLARLVAESGGTSYGRATLAVRVGRRTVEVHAARAACSTAPFNPAASTAGRLAIKRVKDPITGALV